MSKYVLTERDKQPVFLFGKVYEWFVNSAGKLSLRKYEPTDEDREKFGDEVDRMIKELSK